MKNALWFLCKPQDEREQTLYKRAYLRSFIFLILALAGSFTLLQLINYFQLELNIWSVTSLLKSYLFFIILITYLIGWYSVRNEDLTIPSEVSSTVPSALLVLGMLGSIFILFFISLSLFKDKLFLISIIFGVMWSIVTRIFAWKSTNKLETLGRLLLVLLVPFFTILVSRMKGDTLGNKIGKAVGVNILVVTPLAMIIMALFVISKFPDGFLIKPSTSVFEPVLQKDTKYAVWPLFIEGEDPNGVIRSGIYVVYKVEDKLIIGKVLEDSYSEMIIISNENNQTVTLSRKEVTGVIIFPD